MLTLQADLYSASAHYLAQQAVEAYQRRKIDSPGLAGVVRLLSEWNGQMHRDLAAPVITTLLFQHLRKAVAERASPGNGALYESQMAHAVVETILRSRPRDWFADYDQILLRALIDAVEEGRRLQGRNPELWKWGEYSEVTIAHPVFSRLPLFGKYSRIGPAPMSGSSTSVKQTTLRLGPSMRMIADSSAWDRSLANITIGQSDHPLSSHYKDQWAAYYNGQSFPMPFETVSAVDVLTVEPSP